MMLFTVGTIVKHAAREDAYTVMQRADVLFRGHTGRYFGEALAPDVVNTLTKNLASFSTSEWLVKLID